MKIDINKNYYKILGVSNSEEINKIKKSYYKLSMKLHPDKNDGKETDEFRLITEAWSILKDKDLKSDYDRKSRFGKDYDEIEEFFNIGIEYDHKSVDSKYDKIKNREVLDIVVKVNPKEFNGTLEFPRLVLCPTCKGSGKDMSGKIMITNDKGEVKWFETDDGCDFCFEQDNYVISKRGRIKINDIKIGDMVLSQDNSYQKVTDLLSRNFSGEIIDIDVCGLKIKGVTPNHKINVVRFNRNNNNRIKINEYKILEIPVEDVEISDFILYQNQKFHPKDKVVLKRTHNRKPFEIKINDDFVKFIACFIAEGNTRGDRVSVFSFHKDKDRELIDFVIKYVKKNFNQDVVFPKNKKWGEYILKIEIFNSQLSKFLKDFCGHLSPNKYINSDILGVNNHILLDTLLLCDGYEKKSLRTFTSVSENLSFQVFHIAQNLGFNTSISKYSGYVDKNGVNHRDCFRVYISKSKKMGIYKKLIKEGVCLKVKKIEKRNVEDVKVFNITVENTHKYTIDGLLVNNCEGSGKSYTGDNCSFCNGQGKVGIKECSKCEGERRILGKQKLSKIKLEGDETKIDSMGNVSYYDRGKVGNLIIKLT